MKMLGVQSAIIQWTGWWYGYEKPISTTWDPAQSTGYTRFDNTLPRMIVAAKRAGVKLWLGLLLQQSMLDDPASRSDAALLDRVASESGKLANNLYDAFHSTADFGSDVVGWYIPTEPGYQTVANDDLRSLHAQYFQKITTVLHAMPTKLPVMVSPSVPRAIEGNQTGTWFIDRFEPVMKTAGVDVWAMQDGYKMTGWSPAANVAMIQKAQSYAARYGSVVWADLYTPGLGAANGPTPISSLAADLRAVGATGVPLVSWTFDQSMNVDSTLANATARQSLASDYSAYCAVRSVSR
jgi:hypothetical protein